jgi:predicted RNase H-like HicB family nuclease
MAGKEMKQFILCIARGRDDAWEAFCLDFDLAVQGRSFEEARAQLEQAIAAYIESALAEPEPYRSQLLNRRVPLATRLLWTARLAFWTLFGTRHAEEATFSVPVTCPA